MRYLYSVVRFVPDPVRGEFLNVGAIVGSDETSEWQLRTIMSTRRARCLDDRHLLPAVLAFADSIARKLDAFTDSIETGEEHLEAISEEWLARLYVDSMNVVQLTPPAPVIADSIHAAIAIIFDQFIADERGAVRTYDNKHGVLAAMRRAYGSLGLAKGRDFEENAIIRGQVHSEKVDFSVVNGRVFQLVQAWSFRVPDQDALAQRIKAWAWTIEDVRRHGGHAFLSKSSSRVLQVPKNVSIAAVYVPPLEGQDDVYKEAISAFREVKVEPFVVTEADRVSADAMRLLEAAGAGPPQKRL